MIVSRSTRKSDFTLHGRRRDVKHLNPESHKIAKAVSKRQQIEFTETLDADSAALIFYRFGGAR